MRRWLYVGDFSAPVEPSPGSTVFALSNRIWRYTRSDDESLSITFVFAILRFGDGFTRHLLVGPRGALRGRDERVENLTSIPWTWPAWSTFMRLSTSSDAQRGDGGKIALRGFLDSGEAKPVSSPCSWNYFLLAVQSTLDRLLTPNSLMLNHSQARYPLSLWWCRLYCCFVTI